MFFAEFLVAILRSYKVLLGFSLDNFITAPRHLWPVDGSIDTQNHAQKCCRKTGRRIHSTGRSYTEIMMIMMMMMIMMVKDYYLCITGKIQVEVQTYFRHISVLPFEDYRRDFMLLFQHSWRSD